MERARTLLETVHRISGVPVGGDLPATDPVLVAFVGDVESWLSAEGKARLATYAMRLIGTRGSESLSQRRAEYLARVAVTVFAPIALEAANLKAEAKKLRALSPDCSMADLEQAADKASAWASASASASAWAWASASASASESESEKLLTAQLHAAYFAALDGVLAISEERP